MDIVIPINSINNMVLNISENMTVTNRVDVRDKLCNIEIKKVSLIRQKSLKC